MWYFERLINAEIFPLSIIINKMKCNGSMVEQCNFNNAISSFMY